jgi:predicted hydrocarbon binding protein
MKDFKFVNEDHQTVKEAFKKLTHHEQSVISKMISKSFSDDNVSFLKNFIIGFDEDCPMESIICQVMTQIGQHIGKRLFEEVKNNKQYSGSMALKAAIEEIREVIAIIEGTIRKFEEAKQGH